MTSWAVLSAPPAPRVSGPRFSYYCYTPLREYYFNKIFMPFVVQVVENMSDYSGKPSTSESYLTKTNGRTSGGASGVKKMRMEWRESKCFNMQLKLKT